LEHQKEDKNIWQRIPRVLSYIGSQKSVDVLLNNLDQTDMRLRYEIIRALNRLKVNFPLLKFDKQNIRNHLYNEIEHHYKILTLLYYQNKFNEKSDSNTLTQSDDNKSQKVQKLLIQAMEEKLDFNLDRIFRLLGLRYPSKDMYNSYLGIKSKKAGLQANAIEFLDNILDAHLKRIIIPLVEESSYDVLINKMKNQFDFHVRSLDESFDYLLKSSDNWLKICTIHLIAELKVKKFKDTIIHLIDNKDSMVSESARYYMNEVFRGEVDDAYYS
jgi:AAA family ATP:ADP antiporter